MLKSLSAHPKFRVAVGLSHDTPTLCMVNTCENVTCSLCGAQNAPGRPACEFCGGELPVAQLQWKEPAFERAFARPTAVAAGEEPSSSPIVWGPAVASLQTIGRLLSQPDRTFQGFRLHGGFGLPLFFVTVIGAVALGVRALVEPVLPASIPYFWGFFWILPAAYVFVRAHILHLILVLTRRVQASFEVTFRVTSYANGAAAFFLTLPFVGESLFLFLGLWIEVAGLRRCQRLTFAQALVIELIPPAFLLLTVLAVVAARFFVGGQA